METKSLQGMSCRRLPAPLISRSRLSCTCKLVEQTRPSRSWPRRIRTQWGCQQALQKRGEDELANILLDKKSKVARARIVTCPGFAFYFLDFLRHIGHASGLINFQLFMD
jgi:hypothetical protein